MDFLADLSDALRKRLSLGNCHCHVKGKKHVMKFMACLQGRGMEDVKTNRLKASYC